MAHEQSQDSQALQVEAGTRLRSKGRVVSLFLKGMAVFSAGGFASQRIAPAPVFPCTKEEQLSELGLGHGREHPNVRSNPKRVSCVGWLFSAVCLILLERSRRRQSSDLIPLCVMVNAKGQKCVLRQGRS